MQDGSPPLVSIDLSNVPKKSSQSDVALQLPGEVEWQLAVNVKDDASILSCPNLARNCLYWELVGDSDVMNSEAFALTSLSNKKKRRRLLL
jgi:hypothetical protein